MRTGTKIRPYSYDIRLAAQGDKQFDHVQAIVTEEAGRYIMENNYSREPVEIRNQEDGSVLYRGFYSKDNIQLGESKATLEINDPREILGLGSIDKEWNSITLKKLTKYIFKNRVDKYNVLTGLRFATPKVNDEKVQYEDPYIEVPGARESLDAIQATEDFVRDLNPWGGGDGNFDFREETPYSALMETVNIWETQFWVDSDGTLVIGHPDIETTIYPAGDGEGNWKITEWDLPANPTPLKAVVVKGKMEQKGGHDDSLSEDVWNVVSDKKKYQTRAAAGFLDDNDLEKVIMVQGKKETSNPKALRRMARGAFLKIHSQQNSGSITIDADSDNGVPLSDYAQISIGDHIQVNNFKTDCNKLKSGLYSVQSIQHDITGTDGWSITIDVNMAIQDKSAFKDKFWYFDTGDSSMWSGDIL